MQTGFLRFFFVFVFVYVGLERRHCLRLLHNDCLTSRATKSSKLNL
jgi:hypothetical protein